MTHSHFPTCTACRGTGDCPIRGEGRCGACLGTGEYDGTCVTCHEDLAVNATRSCESCCDALYRRTAPTPGRPFDRELDEPEEDHGWSYSRGLDYGRIW